METETEKNAAINWSQFDSQKDDRIKVEVGVKIELGFNSIRQETIEVTDKDRTEEGKIEVKKMIPALELGVDFYNGKPVKKTLLVTSKRLAQTVRTYVEKDMLFKRVFQLEKSGSGFQVQYSLIALNDKQQAKQKSEDVSAFI